MKPITLAEAKTRFKTHTRNVLSDDARSAAKRGKVWSVDTGGVPSLTLGNDEYKLDFICSEYGKGNRQIFCRMNGAGGSHIPRKDGICTNADNS